MPAGGEEEEGGGRREGGRGVVDADVPRLGLLKLGVDELRGLVHHHRAPVELQLLQGGLGRRNGEAVVVPCGDQWREGGQSVRLFGGGEKNDTTRVATTHAPSALDSSSKMSLSAELVDSSK